MRASARSLYAEAKEKNDEEWKQDLDEKRNLGTDREVIDENIFANGRKLEGMGDARNPAAKKNRSDVVVLSSPQTYALLPGRMLVP